MPVTDVEKSELSRQLTEDPDAFLRFVSAQDDCFDADFAKSLDQCDTLDLRQYFRIGARIPFSAHSLGPVFLPAVERQAEIRDEQVEELNGTKWVHCEKDPEALQSMQKMLGFSEPEEFLYTQTGLSENLGKLLKTFYGLNDALLAQGKSKVCYLQGEFFSDQAVIHSVIEGELAKLGLGPSSSEDISAYTIQIVPDARGLYSEQVIIDAVKRHAAEIQVLHLSGIIFNTGQRLDLSLIFKALRATIEAHEIVVGLDLAHMVGNRTINLSALPVSYAVGCAYKHCSASKGSGFGIYVSQHVDLKKYPPMQGWMAADKSQVFNKINTYDASIMTRKAAWAFSCSNPSPIALAEIQTYVKMMSQVGWDKLLARSECLTRYLLLFLERRLGDNIAFITPLRPENRGATLVFRVKGLEAVDAVKNALDEPSHFGQFKIDARPPNLRITPHYGYTRFLDVLNLGYRLEMVLQHILKPEVAAGDNSFFASKGGVGVAADAARLGCH